MISNEDESNAVLIDPPYLDGNVSGVDDGEEEEEGNHDNVCTSQLKAGCEMVLFNGRRIETVKVTIPNGTSDYDSEDGRTFANILMLK